MNDEQFEVLKAKYPESYAKLQARLDAGEITLSKLKNELYRVEHAKRYYKQNQEELLARVNEYNQVHRKEKRSYSKQYDDTHKEQRKEYERQRYLKHKDEILARCKQWFAGHKKEKSDYDKRRYEANKEKSLAHSHKYHAEHPESSRRYRAKRRALVAEVGGSYTAEELVAKFEEFDNRCVYCGSSADLTTDHDIPISRGGDNSIDNIVPACGACNNEKHATTGEEFFVSIDAGKEDGVVLRRYLSAHPEIVDELCRELEQEKVV